MQVRWMALLSAFGLLLIGPDVDPAWAQSPPFDYFSVSPCRLLDTRQPGQGPALASGVSRIVTVTGGSCGIPASARAIAANIASVASTGAGNLRLYPGDGTVPPTSALNFSAGQTRANNGVFPLAGNGNGTLAIRATVASGGTVHAVLDVTGYFAAVCVPSSCPGEDTDCQTRTCTAGVCGFSFQPEGTPTASQTAGDCHQNECDGIGGIQAVADDSDLPDDGQQCTGDVCTAGTPSHPPSPAGTACDQSGGLFCDGAGNCVACLVAGDCPGEDTECQTRTCTDGACGFSFQPSTTTCTGASQGGICDATDHCAGTADTCVDEFRPSSFLCRASAGQCDIPEVCSGSAGACPADAFAPAGTACGEGGFCDGAGNCVP